MAQLLSHSVVVGGHQSQIQAEPKNGEGWIHSSPFFLRNAFGSRVTQFQNRTEKIYNTQKAEKQFEVLASIHLHSKNVGQCSIMMVLFYDSDDDSSLYSFSYFSTSASSSIQLSSNKSPLMILLAMDTLGSLCSGLLQRSIVLEAAFVSIEHQDSHQSHSCGSEKI